MRPSKDTHDELRLAIQDLRWAAAHLANYYNAVRPPDTPPVLTDPNQTQLQFPEQQ